MSGRLARAPIIESLRLRGVGVPVAAPDPPPNSQPASGAGGLFVCARGKSWQRLRPTKVVKLPDEILNAVAGVAVTLDASGVVSGWNAGAEGVSGYSAAEVIGRNWWGFCPESFHPQAAAHAVTLRERGELRLAQPFQHKSGAVRWLEIMVLPLAGGEGFLVVGCQVPGERAGTTPAPAVDPALLQADKNRAISLLARGVAHDFNNIFAAILSHLDLLRTAPGFPAELRENAELAQASARRGADLVGKLQTFSSQSEPRRVPLDLEGLVGEVFVLLRRSIGVDVSMRWLPAPGGLWSVAADANQILQMLFNLCLTAREAVAQGGEIIIRLENVTVPPPVPPENPAGDFVVLAVSGLGPGQGLAALGPVSTRTAAAGDAAKSGGLGLSIADSISAGHGGWLEVERRPGVGTEFRVFLPRADRPAGPAPPTEGSLAAAGGGLDGTETILVVDDEQPLRLLMRAVLGYRGYQIIEAGSGEESLQVFAASPSPVSLVLMDVNLPGLSGWDAMAQLRARSPGLPVVVLSGGYAEEESRRAMALGAADFVSKPFDNLQLVQTVRKVLDEAAARAGK